MLILKIRHAHFARGTQAHQVGAIQLYLYPALADYHSVAAHDGVVHARGDRVATIGSLNGYVTLDCGNTSGVMVRRPAVVVVERLLLLRPSGNCRQA